MVDPALRRMHYFMVSYNTKKLEIIRAQISSTPLFLYDIGKIQDTAGHGNTLIGKKVEVSLQLFDIFERNMVFIFLFES